MNLRAILAKDPSTLTKEEKKFLLQHASELTDEQCEKFGIDPNNEDDDEDDDEEIDDEDDEDDDEEIDDEDDEDEDDDDEDEDEDDDDGLEATPEVVKRLNAQRKHHKRKRQEAEAELARLKKKKRKIRHDNEDGDSGVSQEILNFRFDHPELKTSTVERIAAYAKASGISMRKAEKDPIVKLMIKKARKKSALNRSSIGSNHRSVLKKGKRTDWDESVSDEEIAAEDARRRNAARE